jgi:hypothetical protein
VPAIKEAKARLADNWRRLLAWAGLRENNDCATALATERERGHLMSASRAFAVVQMGMRFLALR